MTDASSLIDFTITNHGNITCSILKWPLSFIRLKGENKLDMIRVAEQFFYKWIHYDDDEVNIRSFTKGVRHNTITPLARIRDHLYEMNLVLRNNRTTKKFPTGIFHPHKDVQHIKKENIGLIEVMGLAILPS